MPTTVDDICHEVGVTKGSFFITSKARTTFQWGLNMLNRRTGSEGLQAGHSGQARDDL